MVEKKLEMQGRMAVGFVDLVKAYDTVPREMVMATVRWMRVPEAEARMVENKRKSCGWIWVVRRVSTS